MKFNNKELMVVRGASTAWPEFTPKAEIVEMLRFDRESNPLHGGSIPVSTDPSESTGLMLTAPPHGTPILVLSASHGTASRFDGGQAAANLDTWLPLWRSTDSLSLVGESGVLLVGVNDLGWVVYDWIPGP